MPDTILCRIPSFAGYPPLLGYLPLPDTLLCRIPSFARIPSFSPFLCPESRTHCIDCSGPFTLGRFHSVPTHSGLGPAPTLLKNVQTHVSTKYLWINCDQINIVRLRISELSTITQVVLDSPGRRFRAKVSLCDMDVRDLNWILVSPFSNG